MSIKPGESQLAIAVNLVGRMVLMAGVYGAVTDLRTRRTRDAAPAVHPTPAPVRTDAYGALVGRRFRVRTSRMNRAFGRVDARDHAPSTTDNLIFTIDCNDTQQSQNVEQAERASTVVRSAWMVGRMRSGSAAPAYTASKPDQLTQYNDKTTNRLLSLEV